MYGCLLQLLMFIPRAIEGYNHALLYNDAFEWDFRSFGTTILRSCIHFFFFFALQLFVIFVIEYCNGCITILLMEYSTVLQLITKLARA